MRRPTLADISPAHIRHGIKTGIAAVLALVLANVLHIEYGYWAVISAVIAMQMNVAEAIEMCLYRFIGTVMGAVMGVGAIMVFPDTPVWNGVSVFVTTGLCAFLTRWDPRYRMAAITVSIVILASAGHAERIDVGLFRVLEIAVGVGCAFVVTVTLWPVRAAVGLRRDLAAQAENCADHLTTLVDNFLARQTHAPANLLDHLARAISRNRERLSKVRRHESLIYFYDNQPLDTLSTTVERTTDHLRTMLRSLNACTPDGHDIIMAPEMRDLAETVARTLRHMAAMTTGVTGAQRAGALTRWLAALGWRSEGGQEAAPQTPASPAAPLDAALARADERLLALREAGATKRFDLAMLTQFYAFYYALRQLAEDMKGLAARMAGNEAVASDPDNGPPMP
ncbi:FUSC family protein [Nitratidesulfovibrio sp. SRB-5]|uniref:FUSC family protein n=1 Tax=Nitratidesulfovibrio sp. SRB-5 TaxID=2872636 RepID=UPI00102796F3|nr:FUSC family protein [Nitratidesulfovibrio sp. SRB-5]MBZ2171921.1 FUSC family protein [Nitratidesulfovibrio sp. SRB-5]RXF78595.1 FUSC family protein [Desulfovibrio sp. DS-1]